jgi:hypothetical protein
LSHLIKTIRSMGSSCNSMRLASVTGANYGTGPLGFLTSSELAKVGIAGNYGIKDQRVSLEWVLDGSSVAYSRSKRMFLDSGRSLSSYIDLAMSPLLFS